MYVTITGIIILICIAIIFIVLVQNPKGGGLGAGFGGGGSSAMGGVQNQTDFLEKTSWGLAIALFVLSLFSTAFLGDSSTSNNSSDAPAVMEEVLDTEE